MGKVKKVLQINKLYYPWIGGVEKHIQDLSEHLLEFDDLDIQVLASNETYNYADEVIGGVKVKKLPNIVHLLFKKVLLFSTPVCLSFPFWLRKIKADILHFHMPNPLGVMSYFLARPKGKLVVTWQSDIVKQKKFLLLYAPFERWFLRRADVIITTSSNLVNYSKFLPPFKDKCKIVPLGINIEDYGLSSEGIQKVSDIKKSHTGKHVLFVGRLVYYKGVKYLIDAMEHIDAELTIIGSGPLRTILEAQIEKKNLSGKVTIIPPVTTEELVCHYHLCDVFVLPSVAVSEAFGIVQLEAMACGKPVVSTNLPTSVTYVNENGKTGIVVEPEDSMALAEAVNKLLNDNNLRTTMGEYAQARVKRDFTNKQVAFKVREIYKELVSF
ncbi:MAG TPA: mannosyltransferase [Candidatus Margulisbacteria bacterium]|nr:mannosyltransferase [Candidatus Margulisiibacteriota bacterium]HCT84154.1 mannosyltransferase [Candidatus Margulisiibacteriota bacterium]